MDIFELPKRLIEFTNRYKGYSQEIEQRFTDVTSEYSKDNLLEPEWFAEDKLPEAINRVHIMKQAGAQMIADYEQYSVAFIKEIYELAYSGDSKAGEKILTAFIKRIAFETNQFKLIMLTYNSIIDKTLETQYYMQDNQNEYEIVDGEIGFYEDEPLDYFQNQLMEIAVSRELLIKIKDFDLERLRCQLQAMNESYI